MLTFALTLFGALAAAAGLAFGFVVIPLCYFVARMRERANLRRGLG